MRIGAVLGPYPGLFWLDVERHQLVIRGGRRGIAAEIPIALTTEQTAAVLEGMLPDALDTAERPTRVRHARIERPTTVACNGRGCQRQVPVQAHGKIPRYCVDCRVSSAARKPGPVALARVR